MPAQANHDATWTRQAARFLESEGYPREPLLRESGLLHHDIESRQARIPFECQARLMELAASVTGDDCFGLHFALTRDVRDAGLLGYVGIASKTVVEALQNLIRYHRVFSEAGSLEFRLGAETGQLTWRPLVLIPANDRQAREFTGALLVRAYRQLSGRNLTPRRVWFTHPRDDRLAEFERLLNAPTRFGQERNLLEWSRADLETPIPTADDRLLAILRDYCEEILRQRSTQAGGLLERVEREIADRLARGEAQAASVAGSLGMSTRTLARRLNEAGTSFAGVLDALRRDLALRYLQDKTLSLTEIAFLLGYSEVSAFNHAFKRWTGQTPSGARERESFEHARKQSQDVFGRGSRPSRSQSANGNAGTLSGSRQRIR
jgi:AraC-like DNA-binding protein